MNNLRENNIPFAQDQIFTIPFTPDPLFHDGNDITWPASEPHTAANAVFVVRFDAARFESRRFSMHDLHCPPRIAASVRRRQAEFFWGRLCARAALERCGIAGRQVPIGPMREPVWPPGVVGSITHGNTLAAAVVLPAPRYGGIGIDIEAVTRAIEPASLLGTIVCGRELAYLRSVCAAPDLVRLLLLVFSAKESFFKAVFGLVNRFIDFDAIEVRHVDLDRQYLTFAVMREQGRRFLVGQTCRIGYAWLDDDHVMTRFCWTP